MKRCCTCVIPSAISQLTNVQSTESGTAVAVRGGSVGCFAPACVGTLRACVFFSRFVLGITVLGGGGDGAFLHICFDLGPSICCFYNVWK